MAVGHTYSTYEAKAKFSEVMRKVRRGQRILITYRGRAVAEIHPVKGAEADFEKMMARLEDEGVLGPARKPTGELRALAKRPGALARFLESRD